MISSPEYLICLDCETPCYTFEWGDEKVLEALCLTCGADDADEFMTEEDYEVMVSAG